MNSQQDKAAYIRLAAVIALAGNTVLAALKIIVGIFSGSGALVGDGIDSSADVLIAVISLIVVRIISKPADAGHPWGHGRAETVATALLSFVLFFAGAQLIYNSAASLISGEIRSTPSNSAVIVTLISIAGKSALAWNQYILGKRSGSAFIKANAKNMAGDILISTGVLAGLAVSNITGSAAADAVIAGLIGVWVIKSAIGIFLEANLELMDGGVGSERYYIVFDAVKSVDGVENPHRVRMRRIAGFWDIDIDVEVDPSLTVADAHGIASRVEAEIKSCLENVFDVVVHIEPWGADAGDEGFGLSDTRHSQKTCGRTED